MLKFAMAASTRIDPGGPSWASLAVPVRLRATPSDAVFTPTVWPAGIDIGAVDKTAPV